MHVGRHTTAQSAEIHSFGVHLSMWLTVGKDTILAQYTGKFCFRGTGLPTVMRKNQPLVPRSNFGGKVCTKGTQNHYRHGVQFGFGCHFALGLGGRRALLARNYCPTVDVAAALLLVSERSSTSTAPPPPPPLHPHLPTGQLWPHAPHGHMRPRVPAWPASTPPPPPPPNRRPNLADFANLFCRFVGFLNFADFVCRFVGFL